MASAKYRKVQMNNPEWKEATAIPDTLVEDTEITKHEVRIQFLSAGRGIDYIESIFKQGLTVDSAQITAVSVTEEVVTTYRRSKV